MILVKMYYTKLCSVRAADGLVDLPVVLAASCAVSSSVRHCWPPSAQLDFFAQAYFRVGIDSGRVVQTSPAQNRSVRPTACKVIGVPILSVGSVSVISGRFGTST